MGQNCSACCCPDGSRGNALYEPILQENEREAVADLLQFLENRSDAVFFEGEPLRALTTLSYSQNVDLQRSAALAFAEITERHVEEVDASVLEPLLYLLRESSDSEVQRAASAALGNLAVNVANKLKIVRLGGLESLIKQMNSGNVEVQCNAVGCITNLATHEENKAAIARSGALLPLTKLAKQTKDIRVQRNATGALLNMTHSEDNRRELVDAGAIPVLVALLKSPDVDVIYYCTTALSNLAVDASNRRKLSQESKLVPELIDLMLSPSLKVQCQAALALRNLASDESYQLDIADHPQGLSRLLALITGTAPSPSPVNPGPSPRPPHPQLVLAAVACIRNISIHPQNETKIIAANFLPQLVVLLGNENEEVQCHAISTIRNLAAGSGLGGGSEENQLSAENKDKIVKSGALDKIQTLIEDSLARRNAVELSWPVLSEMTACLAVLALSETLKPRLLKSGVVKTLIPLTAVSIPSEVQGNAAAALGNMATKAPDVQPFVDNWDAMCGYLERFLEPVPAAGTHYHEVDETAGTFQHIAIWTLMQFCDRDVIRDRILQKSHLLRLIQNLPAVNQDEEVIQLTTRVMQSLGIVASTTSANMSPGASNLSRRGIPDQQQFSTPPENMSSSPGVVRR